MLQREVAETLAAKPGSSDYSRLSVCASIFFASEILFDVPPQAFTPEPQVTSSFLRLQRRSALPVEPPDFDRLDTVVKTAFSQRRKTLENALRAHISAAELEQLSVDPRQRPDATSIEQYVRVVEYLKTRETAT